MANGPIRALRVLPGDHECAHVIRSVAMYRLSRPECSPVDEVRRVQGECVRDVGIGAR
jgi:hypothetical protein